MVTNQAELVANKETGIKYMLTNNK